jgi:hypothetical protein
MLFAWWYRKSLPADLRLAVTSLASFCATVLVVWPSALLKLSFLKAYMVMAYLALFRKNAWGKITLGETWWLRFATSPVECILIVIALASFFLLQKQSPARRGAAIFFAFGALMILATIKVYAPGPRYMTPFFPAFQLFAAWVFAALLTRFSKPSQSYAGLALICLLALWNSNTKMSGYLLHENPGPASLLAAIRNDRLTGKTLLAPRDLIPVLHYYFPGTPVLGYGEVSEITGYRKARHFDGIVYPDYSLIADPNNLRTDVN